MHVDPGQQAAAVAQPASEESSLGIAPRTLIPVFAAMVLLFAVTTLVANAYKAERLARARQYFRMGQALAAAGRNGAAIGYYRDALSISRDSAQYRLAMAQSLLALGRPEESRIYLEELLESDPANAPANLMMANIAQAAGQTDPAITYYHRAIYGYWPQDAQEKRIEARFSLVDLLAKTNARKQLLAELMELADQVRNDPVRLKQTGQMLLHYGDPAHAEELFHDVIASSRNDAEAWAGLGEARFAQGQVAEALAAFRRAALLDPADSTVRKRLALVSEMYHLDPAARRLNVAERYRRSRELLSRVSNSLESCVASQGARQFDSAEASLAQARSALKPQRIRNYDESAESNIALAENLWSTRTNLCGPAPAGDEAVSRIMARLSR